MYAITIDHGYRCGSGQEARRVGELVSKWNVNHIIDKLDYGNQDIHSITNFEEVARFARYERMNKICKQLNISSLFLGHNLDDQLETFVTRLQRNSLILGLKGMDSKTMIPIPQSIENQPIYLYRPLLTCLKLDIISTCQSQGIEWYEDITNQDIDLTFRNKIRYLINEKVPQLNSDYQCISKQNLLVTYNEIVQFCDLVNKRTISLYKYLNRNHLIKENSKNGSLLISFPRSLFIENNQIVLSRFLFNHLYCQSSVKHYHWCYSKLERHLVPKLLNFSSSNQSRLKLTYLNLVFDANKTNDMIIIDISRQPLIKGQPVDLTLQLSSAWSEWVLFDRRFWLRFKFGNFQTATIVLYHHQQLNHKVHPTLKNLVSKSNNNSPALLINNEIVAFPTYNLSALNDLQYEWSLKPNPFTF